MRSVFDIPPTEAVGRVGTGVREDQYLSSVGNGRWLGGHCFQEAGSSRAEGSEFSGTIGSGA